jgi:hypothetical protein
MSSEMGLFFLDFSFVTTSSNVISAMFSPLNIFS